MSPLALSLRFLQTQSDAQLAALARAGHERAFEALVRRYRRQLLSYCRRVNSAGTNAEDTLQQALLQAWSAIRTGVEVRDPRAWLYRIVHNVAVSNQRRPVLVPIELRGTAAANGADQEAEQRMAAREALAGLAALPDLQREVMVGTAVDGMSHDELASALGLSSGAVRGLIYRARATLRAAAAAITPGPVISWALRGGSGPGPGLCEALTGGGSAGIGGLLVKGGVIAATAGAIATATGISTGPKTAHHRATQAAATGHHRNADRTSTASSGSSKVFVVDTKGQRVAGAHPAFTGHAIAGGSAERRGGGRAAHDGFAGITGGRGSGERHHEGSGFSGLGGGSDRGDRGGTSGTGGRRSGHDGSDRGSGSHDGGSGSGSAAPTSQSGSTTFTSGSGSGDNGGTSSGTDGGTRSGTDGGTGSGTDGGSSGSDGSLSISAPVATVSSDGDGGSGHDGGSTTTTATTSTTASNTTTTSSGDGSSSSDSGRDGGK